MAAESIPPPQPSDPVEPLYRELEAKIREYRPKDDLTALQAAFQFARKYHQGQSRDSGEPYMVHPVMVAHILADTVSYTHLDVYKRQSRRIWPPR